MLTTLLEHFPEYVIVDRPTPEFIARYRDLVPPEVLEVWEQYGFGTFCDGYLKVVNPDDYADLLADTYQLTSTPSQGPPVVLFATAMGDLLIWEFDFLSLVDYRHGNVSIIAKGLDFFFDDLADGETLSNQLLWEPYPAAREWLGEPSFDECFGYVPLLALGGPETVEHLEKVKLREHIFLISQFTGILER
ncbi:T6SS immunity protein Tdi1 domain-containing protein [Hymenobacter terrenus]|uniref:T6SS immunity protein Tdi1 domain-containing protein n=1 Tax=Hymenobacter terrenus TaxID=1629124 RepID=UPI0009081D0D|nr:T6SS immunity protein Tdi1 domain-containing protein [Hymenobacter terrenus]